MESREKEEEDMLNKKNIGSGAKKAVAGLVTVTTAATSTLGVAAPAFAAGIDDVDDNGHVVENVIPTFAEKTSYTVAVAKAGTTDSTIDVDEVEKNLDQLKQEFEQAKSDYESAQKAHSQASTDAQSAHTAYDTAYKESVSADKAVSDAEIAQLEEELDALTVAKDKLDAANAELEQLKGDLATAEESKDAADAAVKEQEGVVVSLKAELDAAEQALADKGLALTDYNDLKAAYEQAQSDYETAVANRDAAAQKAQDAQNAIDAATATVNELSATLPGLQSAAQTAAANVQTAQGNYDSALAAYNALLAQAGEMTTPSVDEDGNPVEPTEPPTVDDGALAEAKAALDAAEADLESANSEKSQADAAVIEAENENSAAQEALTAAQGALTDANTELTNATDAVTSATTARDTAKSEYDAAYEENKQTLDEYAAAEQAYNDAKGKYDAGVEKYNELLSQNNAAYDAYTAAKEKYEALKNQVDSDTVAYTKGFNSFLARIDAIQALLALGEASDTTDEDTTFDGYVVISGDAAMQPESSLYLENVRKALDMVKLVNDYRAQNGLGSLSINPTLMTVGACDAAYSNVIQGHANAPVFDDYKLYYSENLAWTSSAENAFAMWEAERELWEGKYASYKEAFDAAVASGTSFNQAAVNLMQSNPEVYGAVGHYLNLVNPDAVGIGVGHVGNTWQMCTTNQSAYDGDYDYDDFVGILEDYMDENRVTTGGDGGASDEEIAAAKDEMDAAYSEYLTANKNLTAQQSANRTNRQEMEAAQKKLEGFGDVSGIKAELERLEGVYNDAESALSDAKEKQSDAQDKVDQKQGEFDAAKKTADEKAEVLKKAQSAASTAAGKVTSMLAAYNEAYEKYQKLLAESGNTDELVVAYKDALAKYNDLVNAIQEKADADAALKTVNDSIEKQNGIIKDKTEERDEAQGDADDIEETLPSLSADIASAKSDFDLVDGAKTVSDKHAAATTKLGELKSAAESAKSEYDRIDGEIDELVNERIPQLEEDVETVANADWDDIAANGSDHPVFAKYVALTKALNEAKDAAEKAKEALKSASDDVESKDKALAEADKHLAEAEDKYDAALAAYLAAIDAAEGEQPGDQTGDGDGTTTDDGDDDLVDTNGGKDHQTGDGNGTQQGGTDGTGSAGNGGNASNDSTDDGNGDMYQTGVDNGTSAIALAMVGGVLTASAVIVRKRMRNGESNA